MRFSKNSKHEARNPKQIQNKNVQNLKQKKNIKMQETEVRSKKLKARIKANTKNKNKYTKFQIISWENKEF